MNDLAPFSLFCPGMCTGRTITPTANLTAHPCNLCCKTITSHERVSDTVEVLCSKLLHSLRLFNKLQEKSTRFAAELLSAAATSARIIYQLIQTFQRRTFLTSVSPGVGLFPPFAPAFFCHHRAAFRFKKSSRVAARVCVCPECLPENEW